ncbi:hypothetical protein Clacol_000210 [Clathrus columnatus]|uniref:Mediator of RNA polymerase II transcription subunit 31 n=1 Tax=Clathrus columnatus TaxID=1419009 RepID=A0AAV4ZYR2_9AGAM|nr:hypothetical protein Clacol_000210 [Clathrus columnatus]
MEQDALPPPPLDARAANRARFELELEFVQALANPFYLHTLAQQNTLSQPAFINYLRYLQYWKEKEYARFILYPHALHHLDLLQHAAFRQEIGTEGWRQRLHDMQFEHWRTWRDDPNRIKTQVIGQPVQSNKEEDGTMAEATTSHVQMGQVMDNPSRYEFKV